MNEKLYYSNDTFYTYLNNLWEHQQRNGRQASGSAEQRISHLQRRTPCSAPNANTLCSPIGHVAFAATTADGRY